MLGRLFCRLGWHKLAPVESTITRKDKYTLEADVFCERPTCDFAGHGEQENYW